MYLVLAIVGLAIGAGAAAFLASRNSDEQAVAPTTTTTSSTSTTTTTTTTLPPAPLTGLGAEADIVTRPAVSVKIDNHPSARPQSGLEVADLVFEERVEGGLTRFLVVFHSTDAAVVGPVRSTRAIDGKVVEPLGGLFAYSGGTPTNVSKIRKVPTITDVGFDRRVEAYKRRDDRDAPHNLYTSTAELYKGATPETFAPPMALFPYRPIGSRVTNSTAIKVETLAVDISGAAKGLWTWSESRQEFLREQNGTPHVVEGGEQLGFENVIVMVVEYKSESSGGDANVTGTGRAVVLTDGRIIEATWTRNDTQSTWALTDGDGLPIDLTPGRTWITLAPTGTTITETLAPVATTGSTSTTSLSSTTTTR